MEAIATVNYLLHVGPHAVPWQPRTRTERTSLSPPRALGVKGEIRPYPCSQLLTPFYTYSVWGGLSSHHVSSVPGLMESLVVTPGHKGSINNGNFLPGALTQLRSSKQRNLEANLKA